MKENSAPTVPLSFDRLEPDVMRARAAAFLERVTSRRSVRHFSAEPIPLDVVRTAILAAGQAPSGAHRQPWTFVLVTDPVVKREIRLAAEAEERENYARRMPPEWLEAVEPFGTDWRKPFLETAPALVVMFRQDHQPGEEGSPRRNYYVQESCGIALGFLLVALHEAGLAALTHTPSPMGFLGRVLRRPSHERAYMLLPVGYPASGCRVPDLERKSLSEILVEV